MQIKLRKTTTPWVLLIFLLLPTLKGAERGIQAWVQRYDGLGSTNDWVSAVAIDNSNNVFVIGQSSGSGSGLDYLAIKYSSSGVPLWTNRYNGLADGDDGASAGAVDGNGDVIVTGFTTVSGGSWDYATIKYSGEGIPLWTNRYNGPGDTNDYAVAVAVDGSNCVIVTGFSAGTGDYPYSYDYLTIKYSSAGVALWTNRYNGAWGTEDHAVAMAVDGSNSVIVTGNAHGDWGQIEYATVKYSSAGVPVWTNRYRAIESYPCAVAVDHSNSVIVTGYSYGRGSFHDYATIKYSSAGVALWTNLYDGPASNSDWANAVAVDSNDNVIVTGFSADGMSSYDSVTIKYSTAGVPLWTNRYRYSGPAGEPSFSAANAVAVDGHDNVIVTGNAGFGARSYFVTIKYSGVGVPLWTNLYDGQGSGNNSAGAVVVDRSGNVVIAGSSVGYGGNDDFATLKYVCVPLPTLTNLSWTGGPFRMRVDDVLPEGELVIEASSNLTTWVPVFTNSAPTNVLFYTEPDTASYARRFYRVVQGP